MKPVPLFGDGVQSYSAVVTSQRRLNCFFDPRSDQDKTVAVLRGTPGTVKFVTLPTSPIRGMYVANGLMYVVAGAILYSVSSNGTITSLASLAAGTGIVSIADNGIQLGIVDGTSGWTFTFAGNVLAKIVDANFPSNPSTIAFLNGRFIVNRGNTRQFYESASYDGATWTPVIFATKENYSDLLLAVEVLNGNLILWGAQSIEFWQDVGAAGVPQQRINGATQTWGLAAVWSRSKLNNSEIFLGQNPQGTIQVLMLNGYSPVRVSTSDIENLINSFSTLSDAVALTYTIEGHAMYQLTFPTAGRSFLYDATTNLWGEVQTGIALLTRHYGNLGVVFNTVNYMSDFSSGNIYRVDENTFTDNGTPIKRQVRTRHIRDGGNQFGISELFIDMETGVGLQMGQGQDPQIMLQTSKDGGRTYGYERWATLGKVGQYSVPRVIWRRMGMARDFVFQITMTDPVKFVIAHGAASVMRMEGEG
jgi:hypothetical protein